MSRLRDRLMTLLRLVLVLPAVLGGTAVALVASGGLGRAGPVAFLGWLAVAPALLTRTGERLVVRRWLCCQALPASQHARLRPVLDLALDRCGIPVDAVDLYVTPGNRVNALSAGRRSMALTRGLVTEVLAGRLPDALLHTVLVQKLGHLANGHRRYALATGWLSAPGRPIVWLAHVLVAVLLRGRALGRARRVIAIGIGLVAVVRASASSDWTTVAILSALGFAVVAAPVLRAWVSRRYELTADRYAARHGDGSAPAIVSGSTTLSRGSRESASSPRASSRGNEGHDPSTYTLVCRQVTGGTPMRSARRAGGSNGASRQERQERPCR